MQQLKRKQTNKQNYSHVQQDDWITQVLVRVQSNQILTHRYGIVKWGKHSEKHFALSSLVTYPVKFLSDMYWGEKMRSWGQQKECRRMFVAALLIIEKKPGTVNMFSTVEG